MLKIKDNVDLKELEKFGFEKVKDEITGDIEYRYQENNDYETICIYESRYITCVDFRPSLGIGEIGTLEPLYDLIKAGLVEKGE